MNSQQPRPRQSASQGNIRTPKNYIQENIAKAKEFAKRHQATPMPTTLLGKGRANSQPAPKVGKAVQGEKVQEKPKLVTVREEPKEERPAQRFAEVVFGEKVQTVGMTYGEIAMKKAAFEEDLRRSSPPKTPTSGPNADTGRVSGRPSLDPRQNASKPTTPTSSSQAPAIISTFKPATPIVPSQAVSPAKSAISSITLKQDREAITGKEAMKVEESVFPLPEPRQSLPLSQTYATSRKSWHASQTALQGDQSSTPVAAEAKTAPEELKKSTPKWAIQPSSQKPEETPMQEIRLFEEETTSMVIEENFPPKSLPEPKPMQPPKPSPSPSPFSRQPPSLTPTSVSKPLESKPSVPTPSSLAVPSFAPINASKSPTSVEIQVPAGKSSESKPPTPTPAFLPASQSSSFYPLPPEAPASASKNPEFKPQSPTAAVPSKPPSQSPTPKSILKKSAPISPQPVSLPEEGANTDTSDSDSQHNSQQSDENKVKAMFSTPVQKRKRFNAALLTEFDVPAEAFCDCDVFYDSQVLSQSAKRRKRTR